MFHEEPELTDVGWLDGAVLPVGDAVGEKLWIGQL
jgi:hypothetical protein